MMARPVFSLPEFLDRCEKLEIRQAKNLSRGNVNKSWDAKHPDWVRDAAQQKYTLLTKAISEKHKTRRIDRANRRKKILGLE